MTYQRQTLSFFSQTPDLIPQDSPQEAWNDAENIQFRNGESQRVYGDHPTLPGATGPIRAMVFCEPQGQEFWVYCTASGIYAHDGTTEYDVTPTWWIESDPGAVYTACVLNGVPFFNASDRDPAWWNGLTGSVAQELPGWPLNGRCYALRAHKSFLFAIGFLSDADMRVRWSDAAEAGTVPQHWEPAPDNLAGFVDLAPARTPTLDGATQRDDFLVYKQDSTWAATFIGGNAVFAFRKLHSGQGIVATNAVTRGPNDEHLFCGSDGDVYLTDGINIRSVLDGRAQRRFYDSFVDSEIICAATLQREKLGLILFTYPTGTQAGVALLFDFASGALGVREVPQVYCVAEGRLLTPAAGLRNTWGEQAETWAQIQRRWASVERIATSNDILVGNNGAWCISKSDARDFAGGTVQARLEKSGLSLGDAGRRKMFTRLWPRITGQPGDVVKFRVGGQEAAHGPIRWVTEVDYTIGESGALGLFCQGRFMAIEVSSDGGASWRLGSIDVDYREVGQW